ncbi:MAG: toast rack family protein [Patescibacteria group bacterium]|nr:toast rack family protein [Patescibacteria group bacterium]
MRENNFNFAKLFLGIFLIFIGLVYLAKTTGLLNIEFNINILELWPVIIIFIGLSLLSPKGWFSVIVSFLVTLIVLGIISFMVVSSNNKTLKQESISIKKEAGVKSAVLDLKTGAGKLTINGKGETLVSGNFESSFAQLSKTSEVQGETQKVELTLKGRISWPIFGRNPNNLDLQVNPDIPLKLNLDTGALQANLDLSNTMMEALDLDTGASTIDLTLGDKVKVSNVNINAGASTINIFLPRTVGAKVNVTSGLSSKNLTNFKKIDPNTFESANYTSSEKKITLNLVIGVSSLNVNWK